MESFSLSTNNFGFYLISIEQQIMTKKNSKKTTVINSTELLIKFRCLDHIQALKVRVSLSFA